MTTNHPSAPEATSSPSAALTRLSNAINDHDLEALVACFAHDFRSDTPTTPGNAFTGVDQVRANWAAIFERTPDITFDVLRSVEVGDTVWAEITQAGTLPTGATLDARGVIIIETTGGLMRHNVLYVNPVSAGTPEFLQQTAGRS